MHWILYLVVVGMAGSYPYHETDADGSNRHVKHFKDKAACLVVRTAEIKELTAADGLLAGKKIGKDFTLTCKKGND